MFRVKLKVSLHFLMMVRKQFCLFARFPSSVERDSNNKSQMMNDLYAGP